MNLYKSDIIRAIQFGSKKLIEGKEELNNINVFPVPDGDTGSNLATMAQSILLSQHSLGDAALDGARGNSGVIFAQFLYQLDQHLSSNFSTPQFAHAFKYASDQAYNAVPSPQEGTILSVMKEWANYLVEHCEKLDFKTLITNAEEVAKIALKNTTLQLESLKIANVVDAGAKGFVFFIEGMKEALLDYTLQLNIDNINIETLDEPHIESLDKDSLHNRYCTEALLVGENLDKDQILKILEQDSDSIVLAGDSQKLKAHFHTNNPAELFAKLDSYGTMAFQKVEDMHRQYSTIHERKYNIALVVDSGISIPSELIDEYQIHVVPVNILVNDQSYIDHYGITLNQCLEHFKTNSVKTSQPAPKAFANTFSFLSNYYDSIIVVTVSKVGSGTHNSAIQGIKLANTNTKIDVLDSTTVASSAAMVALQVAEEIKHGVPHHDIVNNFSTHTSNAKEIISLKSINQLIKGGRLKPSIGKIFQHLHLLPIITAKNGMPYPVALSFGFKNNLKQSLNFIKKDLKQGRTVKDYIVGHACYDVAEIKNYIDGLTKEIGKPPRSVFRLNASLATHVGNSGVSVGLLYNNTPS